MPLLEGQAGPFQLGLGLSFCQLPSPAHTLALSLVNKRRLLLKKKKKKEEGKKNFHICVSCFKSILSCHKKKGKYSRKLILHTSPLDRRTSGC